MLGSKRGYLPLRLGRFHLRIHFLLPVAIVGLGLLEGYWFPLYAILLGCLFLHETGHALASLLLGGHRAVVFLHPVFGWAAVQEFPDRREAWTAMAGPGVNFLLGGALAAAGAAVDLRLAEARTIDFLLTVTLAMGLGNLIPIPWTDGGRILKALFCSSPDQDDPS